PAAERDPPSVMKRRHATASRAGVAVRHGVTRRFLVTIVWVLMMWSSLPAQTGSVLAVLPGSARTAGMGGAGGAMVGDGGASFANRAGLARVHRLAGRGACG